MTNLSAHCALVQVIRRDEMQEDLDVDELGRTIYRKDYTGSYNNPNAL